MPATDASQTLEQRSKSLEQKTENFQVFQSKHHPGGSIGTFEQEPPYPQQWRMLPIRDAHGDHLYARNPKP